MNSLSQFPQEYNLDDYFSDIKTNFLLARQNPKQLLFRKTYLKTRQQKGLIQKELQNRNHPYLCAIHKIYDCPQQIIIIMEWCPNKLRQIDPKSPLFIRKLLQISKGVQYLHGLGIIHLDLKPENVMISKEGTAKILDFDISKKAIAEVIEIKDRIGTFGYMPPQIDFYESFKLPIDYSADVWSLGALIYNLLTTKHIDLNEIDEIDEHQITVYQSQITQTIQRQSFSVELKSLLEKMLQINRIKRSSIGQVVRQLQRIQWKEDLIAANYTGTLRQREGNITVYAFVVRSNTLFAFLKKDWLQSIKQWEFTILNRTYSLSEVNFIPRLKYYEYEGALIIVENESSAQQKLKHAEQEMDNLWNQHYPLLTAQQLLSNSLLYNLYLGNQFLESVTFRKGQQGQLTFSRPLQEDNLIPGRPVIAELEGVRYVAGIHTGWFNVSKEPVMLCIPEDLKAQFGDASNQQNRRQPRKQRPQQKKSIISLGKYVPDAKVKSSSELNKYNSITYLDDCILLDEEQARKVIRALYNINNQPKQTAILNARRSIIQAKNNQTAKACKANESASSYFREIDLNFTLNLDFQLGFISDSKQTLDRILKEHKNESELPWRIVEMRLINKQIDGLEQGEKGIPKLGKLIQQSVSVLRSNQQSRDQFLVMYCLNTINKLILRISQLFWVTIKSCLQEDLKRKVPYFFPQQLAKEYNRLPDKNTFHRKESIEVLRKIKQTFIRLNDAEFSCRFDSQVNDFLNRLLRGFYSKIANTLLDK